MSDTTAVAARLGLVILAVDDLRRATGFYQSVFGWPVTVEVPVYAELALPDGMRLGLYERTAFARNTGRPPAPRPAAGTSATELYLYPDDLEATIARLVAAGAPELAPLAPRDWGDDVAYFADPEGNVLAVATPGSSSAGA